MLRALHEPEVIAAELNSRAEQAAVALARRIEAEWHPLDKLMEELLSADRAGELQGSYFLGIEYGMVGATAPSPIPRP